MLESKIEKEVCAYAKAKKWKHFKFNSDSNRGLPDRIFFRKGVCFLIEFKQKGKELRKLQKHYMDTFKEEGFATYVIDNIDDGIRLINTYD